MNPKNPRRWLKAIPLAAFLICITAFFLVGRSLTYQELANWLPENQATAAALVILLYTAKSMTVFFPLLTLYLLSGILFPTPTAVLVNLLGLAACDTANNIFILCSNQPQ